MFAISEYIGKNGNRQDKLEEIYEKGPNFLMNFILSQLGKSAKKLAIISQEKSKESRTLRTEIRAGESMLFIRRV